MKRRRRGGKRGGRSTERQTEAGEDCPRLRVSLYKLPIKLPRSLESGPQAVPCSGKIRRSFHARSGPEMPTEKCGQSGFVETLFRDADHGNDRRCRASTVARSTNLGSFMGSYSASLLRSSLRSAKSFSVKRRNSLSSRAMAGLPAGAAAFVTRAGAYGAWVSSTLCGFLLME